MIYEHNTGPRKSAIMTLKDGAWEAGIGPFDAGDRVSDYVSATDNTSRRMVTPDQRFVVRADTPD